MKKKLKRTEQHKSRYSGLDTWPDAEILETLWASQLRAISCIQSALPSIEKSALAIVDRLSHEGRLFYVGAGSSGHIAIQDGLELTPTYGWPLEKLIPLIAGGDKALLSPMGGAEDEEHLSVEALIKHDLRERDVIIAVAASGSTPFTLAAVKHARTCKSLVISISNNKTAPIFMHSDHSIFLDSGSEVIAGSTRMAAGTSQKAALNMLSTLVMTKLGHVHDGLMVSMEIKNEKLAERAIAIVQKITGESREKASASLEKANNNIKLAVLLAIGYSTPEAKRALEKSMGHLRQALKSLNFN